jgi:hypothetical protein
MADDFLGSIAQEDIDFSTQIIQNVTVGENYYSLAVYIEADRFIADATAFAPIPGTDFDVAMVTKDSYASVTKGLLLDWLTDFYISGASANVYLITCVPQLAAEADLTEEAIEAFNKVFELTKQLAYHKTACIVVGADDSAGIWYYPALLLAQRIAGDSLLSGSPYYPVYGVDPVADTDDPLKFFNDPLYLAIKGDAIADAYMTAHGDIRRNGALFQLGLALATYNNSGTPIGNSIDFVASTSYTVTQKDVGIDLTSTDRQRLKGAHIAFFKFVGNATGSVAAVGGYTIKGKLLQAYWVVAYCNYMNKVNVATFITRMNTFRDANSYSVILEILLETVSKFGTDEGSGRLVDITITAPAFSDLPKSAQDEIIIPNAWTARYVDQLRSVRVFGELVIGGE